jgi:hypothetical protein
MSIVERSDLRVPVAQDSRRRADRSSGREIRRSASIARREQAAWGRIGGLTTSARYGGHAMTRPARRGFQERFEREVDPEGRLEPGERVRRAERAMRAHMLRLAQASADARAKRPSPRAAPRNDLALVQSVDRNLEPRPPAGLDS